MATTRRLQQGVNKLLKESSDISSAIRLNDTVLNSPTLATPPVPAPGEVKADDTAAIIAARAHYVQQQRLVQEAMRFEGVDKDVAKLGKLIVRIKTAFSTSGLDLAFFDFDDPAKGVIKCANDLFNDTFEELIEPDSTAA
ncbi:hypothetical protein CYMTET_56725 [Cymbomonas tetramitiformis]|uniref:Uncharacterized protein n=1 Tax=Cymbomonas tetramitiformis TaxID=36881 RepID=A0AAE0ELP4_9CHLO|nr:hypothetical protein CYMTET_56725 [Cymbomonas tetramitiformis]